MCAKMAKQTQTDYTRGGKAISDTSIPLYQTNLQRMDTHLSDPTQAIDRYLDKYYTNTANENDFLRNYNRAMSNQTASNYAATHGGYSSANQMSYDDLQRSMNDEAARLRDYGITSSAQLANQDFSNMLNANNAYYNAYGLGKPYSDVEQYNYLAKQNNRFGNQLAQSAGTIGTAIGSIWGPAGAAIGGALGNAVGGMGKTDVSSALAMLSPSAGAIQQENQKIDMAREAANNPALAAALEELFPNGIFNRQQNQQQTTNSAAPTASQWANGSNLNNVGNYSLYNYQPQKFLWQQ